MQSISPLTSLIRPFAAAYLALGAVVRVGLWAVFRSDSRVSFKDLLLACGVGLLNDVVQLMYLAVPLLLILCLFSRKALVGRAGTISLGIVSLAAVWGALFIAIAEVLFWEEFESRFNLIAVDYLIYPTEVLGNIHESYPVIPLFLGIGVVGAALWWPLWKRGRSALHATLTASPLASWKLRALATYSAFVIPLPFLFSADTLSL